MCAGARFLTVILLSDVLKFLGQRDPKEAVNLASVQDFLFKCTEGDMEALQEEGGAFCATVGPNDVMYFPAGCVVSHRVHSQDIAGVRLGVLTQDMYMHFLRIAKLQDENGCIEEALKFLASKNVEGNDESLARRRRRKRSSRKPNVWRRSEKQKSSKRRRRKPNVWPRTTGEKKRKANKDEEAKRKEAEETRKAEAEEAKRKEGERLAEQQRREEGTVEDEKARKEAERLAQETQEAEEKAKSRAEEAERWAKESNTCVRPIANGQLSAGDHR